MNCERLFAGAVGKIVGIGCMVVTVDEIGDAMGCVFGIAGIAGIAGNNGGVKALLTIGMAGNGVKGVTAALN